ncbi:unnamed protein product [Musa acuminata subsp. malaccensis]|uniref:(wild Malaysian banana) hypothetical protein n=1 Tax=Musa acuminata subsp. malaccensis TaxID=214687 RepID=A0A804K9M9_MUSAM|nr:PREDICTED: uncharacterized protein LOC103995347 [Musa acuminata subsp. malaccensis]CAG1832427.1 unnamed protein product [Musa acuminata subsp. malaccensis]
MGCGGSKQDVATGNTITRRILRRPSSVSKSKASSALTNGDASKKQTAEANGAAGEAKLVSKESSEEYFSSRREIECLDVVTGSEGAEYFSPIEDSDANVKTAEGSGEIAVSEAKNGAAFGRKEEKEQIGRKEDDGESLGKQSVDFKEAISIDEAEAEKKSPGEKETAKKSSAH